MYACRNFKTKKGFKVAVIEGEKITIYAPGIGTPKVDGKDFVEGPWYPQAHSWYAEVTMENGLVVKVK